MNKVCVVCGKEFDTKHSKQIYCSKTCKYDAQNRRNRKEAKARTCVICGSEYMSTNVGKLTCSKECSRKLSNKRCSEFQRKKREKLKELGIEKPKKTEKNKNRRWIKPVFKPRICVKCGKEYIPCNGAQKYCSPVCHYPHLAKNFYKEPEPLKGLALDNQLAREQGLTYGQWRGLQTLKELKEK